MLKLIFTCLMALNSLSVFAAKNTTKTKKLIPTMSMEQSSRQENEVGFRILRNYKYKGVYFNLISDATVFVMTLRYTNPGTKLHRYHNCLFIVKGNLSLEQVQHGLYQAKDIVSTQCSTEDIRI